MSVWLRTVEPSEFVAINIAPNSWDLREQVEALEAWLEVHRGELDASLQYIADIGFEERAHAGGGGPPLSCHFMSMCLEVNLEVWLSEYPADKKLEARQRVLREQLSASIDPGSQALAAAREFVLADCDDWLTLYDDDPDGLLCSEYEASKALIHAATDPAVLRLALLRQLAEIRRRLGPDVSDEDRDEFAHARRLVELLMTPE